MGGGIGRFLSVILDAHPHLQGTVFDLPATVGRVLAHPRLDAIGGSFFEEVPAGFDLYLLHVVIHDWNDHEALRILAQVRRAMQDHARVVVIESALDPGRPVLFGHQTDLEMLVLTGSDGSAPPPSSKASSAQPGSP
ncbi:MAG: methyltransferase [Acidimicrobiales bacterium]